MQPLEPLLNPLTDNYILLRLFRTQIEPQAFCLLCKNNVLFLEQHYLFSLSLQLYDKLIFLLESLLDLLFKH